MSDEHSLKHIVATDAADWHYDIPDGYFDNIDGACEPWWQFFLRLNFHVLFSYLLTIVDLLEEYKDHELVKEVFNLLSKVRLTLFEVRQGPFFCEAVCLTLLLLKMHSRATWRTTLRKLRPKYISLSKLLWQNVRKSPIVAVWNVKRGPLSWRALCRSWWVPYGSSA